MSIRKSNFYERLKFKFLRAVYKTAAIFFNSILFDGKRNLVGAFSGGQILKYSIVLKSALKNSIKIKEKQGILVFVFGVTLKQMNLGTYSF